MDEPGSKGQMEEVEGDQTRIFHVLDRRWILPEDVWRRVEEARREEHVIDAQLRRGEAKEVAVEALLRPSRAQQTPARRR